MTKRLKDCISETQENVEELHKVKRLIRAILVMVILYLFIVQLIFNIIHNQVK